MSTASRPGASEETPIVTENPTETNAKSDHIVTFHEAHATEIDAATLYRILKLRVDVFILEQRAFFADLDGRDLVPSTRLAWAAAGDEVLATLRVLDDAGTRRHAVHGDDAPLDDASDAIVIGRVATAESARGRGIARVLVQRAVDAHRLRPIRIEAQERLSGWYATFGFVGCGPTYIEDDILHLPMLRPADER
ncbi:GNAT family N-acetyltransferase [Plantibacter sp. Mn2098]|uniref:GNAT family N-acetyltransferase n=1 Tax=Plantibacter sp. Mn2098 TaxID=3395266 RepID=UPI003BCB11D7